MARPNWEYIRVDVLLPTHPKLIGASSATKWSLIEAWCYCARHLTDGFIPDRAWARIGKARDRQPLIDLGMAERVPGGYQMHDYLGHQRSRADAEELSRKRADAGRKGGQAKANAVALAKQMPGGLPPSKPSKSVAEAEAEAEADRSGAGAVDHPSRRNGQSGVDDEIDLIISEIHLATGRDVSRTWAADVRATLMNGREVANPAAYLRQIIRTERDPAARFLPAASAHPSARPVSEANLAAGIAPNGTPARGEAVAAIAAHARAALHAPKGDHP